MLSFGNFIELRITYFFNNVVFRNLNIVYLIFYILRVDMNKMFTCAKWNKLLIPSFQFTFVGGIFPKNLFQSNI